MGAWNRLLFCFCIIDFDNSKGGFE